MTTTMPASPSAANPRQRPRPGRTTPIGLALAIAAGLLAGCAQHAPPPEWEQNAHGAATRASEAYLSGDDRVAAQEWRRARSEVARTARPDLLARVVLLECAVRVASLAQVGCPDFEPLREGADAAEKAYARYLEGRAVGAAAGTDLLPPAQRAVRAGGSAALAGVDDPLARLVAAAVLHARGETSPEVARRAIEAASERGWRRPLMAWLLRAVEQAQQRGDAAQVEVLRQRLRVLQGGGN